METKDVKRILVVGSGAREHALVWACQQSGAVKIYCAPGNAGTAQLAENVPIAVEDVYGLVEFAQNHTIDLVIIGPESAVVAGLAEACAVVGIPCFGPSTEAGRIESSKIFAKQLMDDIGVPTARWRAFDKHQQTQAETFADELNGHCVVKADGLASGKGVFVCDSLDRASAALNACFVESRFGASGHQVLVEEVLYGDEVSVFALTDGTNIRMLVPAQDYKRAYDDDQGSNTGGMGSFAPCVEHIESFLNTVSSTIMQPVVDELRRRGTPYRGCLYAGLIQTNQGLRVIEFNARLGDPEAQVILPLLAENALELMYTCASGNLIPGIAAYHPGSAVGVVLTTGNYPDQVETGALVSGVKNLNDALAFHGGTKLEGNNEPHVSAGRVMTIVSRGPNLESARQNVYKEVSKIHFEGSRYRRDIGGASLDKLVNKEAATPKTAAAANAERISGY